MKKLAFLTFTLVAFLLAQAAPSAAADGYWAFERYGEKIPDRKSAGKACTVNGIAKMNGSSMEINCTDVYGKPYTRSGHFSWQFDSKLDAYLIPGEKILFKGSAAHTGGVDATWTGIVTQGSTHPSSGRLTIFGTDHKKVSKAGMSHSAEGVWTVPGGPTRAMPDGKPSNLLVTFELGTGTGQAVSKYLFYKWIPGKPASGTEAKPLTSDPAGTMGPPAFKPGTPAQSPPAAAPAPAKPVAQQPTKPVEPAKKPDPAIFDTFNTASVGNNPTVPTMFTLRGSYVITQIMTYHWNNGRGMAPGTIALKGQTGKIYGPWPAKATAGSGAQNVFWTVNPNVRVPAGTYTVVDSDPVTWSMNGASENRGFAQILGHPAN